ncbi:MAG: sodium:solute symporter [Nocardia sp.]|uniref:sodium:solute symporter family protein n=1 Tax=Nocardia sp. TaxID=1821 RepID=UPI00260B9CE6|nr:sodium:solute symporter family protein [Nocardia sp.]MCU1644122.1 sodium:solute symporter [Nocardia sp.]
MILTIALIGMAVIAALGLRGRRGTHDLAEWTVGGRNFGKSATWFLQAGEGFTTFTFLGVANRTFIGGATATYAIPYIPLSYIGVYFLGPRLWRLAKENEYLTQADYFADRYRSPLFGKLVALIGVVFLLPYLQLQITGLGTIVQLVTGSRSSGNWSMAIATGLMVAFVLWSGIRGIASTAYLKDALMILAMVVLVIAVPAHFAGGVGDMFHEIRRSAPQLLTVPLNDGPAGSNWWISGVLISAIGSAFFTLPHLWPPLLASRDEQVIRSNNTWLPLYQVVIILPIIVGFTGLLAKFHGYHVPPGGVLLWLAGESLPKWMIGVIAVAAAAAAMVPAAAISLGISSLVARNLIPLRGERARLALNHGTVIVVAGLTLLLAVHRPSALADLLLLTFSGLAQTAPAFLAALGDRRWLDKYPAMAGLLSGIAVVAWAEIGKHAAALHNISSGIVGLVVNLAVCVVAQTLWTMIRKRTAPGATAPAETGVRAAEK